MKIDLYTLCYNEARIIPFVIDYWKYIGIHHAYVFDNYSTDNSVELLKSYGDWITVIPFESDDSLNDLIHVKIKDNCWKHSICDYVMVCDFDEVLWHENLKGMLEDFAKRGVSLVKPRGIHLYARDFPSYERDTLLHLHAGIRFLEDPHFEKCILFSPQKIKEINYSAGAHFCQPVGEVMQSYLEINLLHLKFFGPEYLVGKYKASGKRLSEPNKNNRWGCHYLQETEKTESDFEENYRRAKLSLAELIQSSTHDSVSATYQLGKEIPRSADSLYFSVKG